MVNQGLFAENVRHAAGAHLVSLNDLASYVGLSRPGIMKLVAYNADGRSLPSGATAVKLAEAFGVDVRDLYSEPADCMRAVAEAFESAPIREVAKLPEAALPFSSKRVSASKPVPKFRVEKGGKS